LFLLDFKGVLHQSVFSQDQYNAFFTVRPPHLSQVYLFLQTERKGVAAHIICITSSPAAKTPASISP
jgi:hypothetical protein